MMCEQRGQKQHDVIYNYILFKSNIFNKIINSRTRTWILQDGGQYFTVDETGG